MKKSNQRTYKLVLVALLGALALVLRQFDFPLLPAAPFLKFDFSEIPVIVGMLSMGMKGLVGVSLIRDILGWLISGGTMGLPLGAIMSTLASVFLFLPTHLMLKKGVDLSRRKGIVINGILMVVSITVFMSVVNYFIMLPIYTKVAGFNIENKLMFVLSTVVPFNVIKGFIYVVLQHLIIKVLKKFLLSKKIYYYVKRL